MYVCCISNEPYVIKVSLNELYLREMTTNYIALFILANRCVFSFFLNTTTDSVFLTSSGKLFHTVSDERVKDLDASLMLVHLAWKEVAVRQIEVDVMVYTPLLRSVDTEADRCSVPYV